jgi:hypothetical protein
MVISLDIGGKLARALQVDESEAASRWRAHVRQMFADVDSSELLRCAKNRHSNLYAALAKREPSSMYSIAIRSRPMEADRIMDLGLVRDSEWVGDPASDAGGFLVWVSTDFAPPLTELIGHLGVTDTVSFPLDGGTAIDLRGGVSNDDLFDLVRLAVVELIAAFDISGKEWADQDRIALAQAIHAGFTGTKHPTL